MKNSQWQSFSGLCLFVSLVGTTYAFSVYSPLLESVLGFTTEDLDVIASVGNTGLYLSIITGFVYEEMGLHFVVGIGAILIFIGFLYIYCSITEILPANMLSICVLFFLAQFGVCCHISSAVTCSVQLIPRHLRGTAVGLIKGYFAISSAVLGDVAMGYFSNNSSQFILFVAVAIPLLSMLGASFVSSVHPDDSVLLIDSSLADHGELENDKERLGGETNHRNTVHHLTHKYHGGTQQHGRESLATTAAVGKRSTGATSIVAVAATSDSLAPFIFHWIAVFVLLLVLGYISNLDTVAEKWTASLSTILLFLIVAVVLLPNFYIDERESSRTVTHSQDNRHMFAGFQSYGAVNEDVLTSQADTMKTNDNTNYCDGSNSGEDSDENNENYNDLSRDRLNSENNGFFQDDNKDNEDEENTALLRKISETDYVFDKSSSGTLRRIGSNDDKGKRKAGNHPSNNNHTHQVDASSSAPYISFYGVPMSLPDCLVTYRFWILFGTYFIIGGTGLMVIDNINAIAEAVGTTPSAFFVTLVSLANGLGRILAGTGSDYFAHRISKLKLMAIVALLMTIAQGLFALGNAVLLYPCLLLTGFVFGCTVALMAINIAEIFGISHIATIFGAIETANILGSYVFVTGVVSLFYEENVVDDAGDWSCLGATCFRYSFMINCISCIFITTGLFYMDYHTKISPAALLAGH